MQFVFGAARSRHHLDELLPRRFGPHDLLSASAFPLLMEPQHNAVALTAAGKQAVAARQDDELFQQAVELALQNAQQVGGSCGRLAGGMGRGGRGGGFGLLHGRRARLGGVRRRIMPCMRAAASARL